LRREAALELAKSNQGRILTGALWDRIAERLPAESPGPEADQLFDEIEALDGTERSQRSLRDFLQEILGTPMPLQPRSEVHPPELAQHQQAGEVDRDAVPPQPARKALITRLVVGMYSSHRWLFNVTIAVAIAIPLTSGFAFFYSINWDDHTAQNPSSSSKVHPPAQTSPQAPITTNPRVALDTEKGRIVIELYRDSAPRAVQHFLADIAAGEYNHSFFFAHNLYKLYARKTNYPDDNDIEIVSFLSRGSVVIEESKSCKACMAIVLMNDPFVSHVARFGRVVEGLQIAEEIAASLSNEPNQVQIQKATRLADDPVISR
jgi:cyclophilin family peptidyl-prolyl cis-trans isomerase